MGDDIPEEQDQKKEREFNEIVLKYSPRIYKNVRGMVGNHEDTDDIIQETFLKAYKNIKSFKGEADVGTWLMRIALNIVFSRSRRKKIFSSVSLEDYSNRLIANEKSPEESIVEAERRRIVREGLSNLPEKQRAVFVLRMYDDMSFREISEIMETSESASRANFHQALNKLKLIAAEQS